MRHNVGKLAPPPGEEPIFGEMPFEYEIVVAFRTAMTLGPLVVPYRTMRVPAYPRPVDRVTLYDQNEQPLKAWYAAQWQRDDSGEVINDIARNISRLNLGDLGAPPHGLMPGLINLIWYEDKNGDVIEVLADDNKGSTSFILVAINRREDAYWSIDEWTLPEDQDLDAIGAIFGSIKAVYEEDYVPHRPESQRPPIY